MERINESNDQTSLAEVRKAVQQVLDYLHDDERTHYENCDAADRGGHILESLERLRRWLAAMSAEDENGKPASREALERPVSSACNRHRATAAAAALSSYVLAKSQNPMAPLQSPEEWLIDLLTDLRHHAADVQIDFAVAVRISEYHFEEESCSDV